MKKFYFGYGSNLNIQQMKMRCPDAEPVGVATLRGHKLIFRGVADIIETGDPKDEVKGAVWSVTDKCLKALDRYEGYPRLYGRKNYRVLLRDGFGRRQTVTAFGYYMQGGRLAQPSRSYWSCIMRGYYDFNIEPSQDLLKPNTNLSQGEDPCQEEERHAFS